MSPAFTVEPSGRGDEWEFIVRRVEDDVIVGFHMTRERAQAFADNGGEPIAPTRAVEADEDQLDMFGVHV